MVTTLVFFQGGPLQILKETSGVQNKNELGPEAMIPYTCKYLLTRCFRNASGVQIPSPEVFVE